MSDGHGKPPSVILWKLSLMEQLMNSVRDTPWKCVLHVFGVFETWRDADVSFSIFKISQINYSIQVNSNRSQSWSPSGDHCGSIDSESESRGFLNPILIVIGIHTEQLFDGHSDRNRNPHKTIF
jgi:hypothetical protein